jgi:hypothetical protein
VGKILNVWLEDLFCTTEDAKGQILCLQLFSSVFQTIFCFENLKLIFPDTYFCNDLNILILKILKKYYFN